MWRVMTWVTVFPGLRRGQVLRPASVVVVRDRQRGEGVRARNVLLLSKILSMLPTAHNPEALSITFFSFCVGVARRLLPTAWFSRNGEPCFCCLMPRWSGLLRNTICIYIRSFFFCVSATRGQLAIYFVPSNVEQISA